MPLGPVPSVPQVRLGVAEAAGRDDIIEVAVPPWALPLMWWTSGAVVIGPFLKQGWQRWLSCSRL